jgi:transposase-like protein
MGAGVAVRAVILRYLDQVARARSIRRAAEDLPAERGLDVSYETVRRWVSKFGPDVFGEDRPNCAIAAGGQRKAFRAASG